MPKNSLKAAKWFQLAEAQGDRQAKPILVFLRPKMTARQIARAEALVRVFPKKVSDDAAKGIPLVAPPLE